MEYIGLTIGAMAVTILLVYKLANSVFRLGLKLKPLILCAICALFLSIILPRIVVGFAGLAGTIGFLAVVAIIFAYFVAYYEGEQEPQISNSAAALIEQPLQDASKSEPGHVLPATSLHRAVDRQSAVTEEVSSTIVAVVPHVSDSKAGFTESGDLVVSDEPKEEVFLPADLDDLLDLAFAAKERAEPSAALIYFREALKRHPESEAAPYIVVEIATLLKDKGSYDEAIRVFIEGRNLPKVQADGVLSQEFTETIAYLRITRNALLQRRLGFVPFHKIPADVTKDIDEEFREWRNLA
ncbi:MAG: hypothetical protein N2491_02065 [Negativicutes bacterium]|nr:hypothetical protein [Negativicutes bacterium]